MNEKIEINKEAVVILFLFALFFSGAAAFIIGALISVTGPLSFWASILVVFVHFSLLLLFWYSAMYFNYFFKIKSWLMRTIIIILGLMLASIYPAVVLGWNFYGFLLSHLIVFMIHAGWQRNEGDCPKNPFAYLLVSTENN